ELSHSQSHLGDTRAASSYEGPARNVEYISTRYSHYSRTRGPGPHGWTTSSPGATQNAALLGSRLSGRGRERDGPDRGVVALVRRGLVRRENRQHAHSIFAATRCTRHSQETDDELNDQWFNEMKEISLRKEALLQNQLEVAAENQRLMQEMIAEQRHLRAAQRATQASHEKLRKEQAEATKKLNKISSTLEAILLDSRQQQADKENDPGIEAEKPKRTEREMKEKQPKVNAATVPPIEEIVCYRCTEVGHYSTSCPLVKQGLWYCYVCNAIKRHTTPRTAPNKCQEYVQNNSDSNNKTNPKALYGLKVSPKRWNERFSEVATELGLENDINEPCLYTWCLAKLYQKQPRVVADVLKAAYAPPRTRWQDERPEQRVLAGLDEGEVGAESVEHIHEEFSLSLQQVFLLAESMFTFEEPRIWLPQQYHSDQVIATDPPLHHLLWHYDQRLLLLIDSAQPSIDVGLHGQSVDRESSVHCGIGFFEAPYRPKKLFSLKEAVFCFKRKHLQNHYQGVHFQQRCGYSRGVFAALGRCRRRGRVAKRSGQGTTASPTLQTRRDVSTPLRAIDVVLVIGLHGCLRSAELLAMQIQDVKEEGKLYHINVPETKTGISKSFVTSAEVHPLITNYIKLRPKEMDRFFLQFRNETCTRQTCTFKAT
ncbi:unnamed protein product, partial [Trichogramma brassicae]